MRAGRCCGFLRPRGDGALKRTFLLCWRRVCKKNARARDTAIRRIVEDSTSVWRDDATQPWRIFSQTRRVGTCAHAVPRMPLDMRFHHHTPHRVGTSAHPTFRYAPSGRLGTSTRYPRLCPFRYRLYPVLVPAPPAAIACTSTGRRRHRPWRSRSWRRNACKCSSRTLATGFLCHV